MLNASKKKSRHTDLMSFFKGFTVFCPLTFLCGDTIDHKSSFSKAKVTDYVKTKKKLFYGK